ncbi:MAG: MerR family transcriptional regulator [Bacteroidetes bacterium]|nr:MerR family transcriptional regulator [Bacteroidota bacterium]
MPPYKEKEPQKMFYSIGEVARMFKLAPSHIRFWESQFTVLKPKRNKKGNRLFTKEDLDNFHTIYHLVKERGFTLEGAKQKLKRDKKEVEESIEIVKSLKKIKGFLVEMKESL